MLNPRIDFRIHEFERGKAPIVLFEIQAASEQPVNFGGEAFIRVGSSKRKLKDYPAKQQLLWRKLTSHKQDWSSQIVQEATLRDLDPEAMSFARAQYREKHPNKAADIDGWDEVTFLNKAKICIGGKLTRAALLLLGKEESTHFISPSQARITWLLRDDNKRELDYQHLDPPFILAGDRLLSKIRNLMIRQMPSHAVPI
jgi:ATP-dependent DNA helicase RecG